MKHVVTAKQELKKKQKTPKQLKNQQTLPVCAQFKWESNFTASGEQGYRSAPGLSALHKLT